MKNNIILLVLILVVLVIAGVFGLVKFFPSTTVTPATGEPCYISGCSNQICSDQEGLITTCEYKAEYACYKTATCARQPNGQCGWTQTPALKACLSGK